MHLLAAQPGTVNDGETAVDLAQTPGDMVVLSAADGELALLTEARRRWGERLPSLRLANLMRLGHHLSVDLYVDGVIAKAKLVIVRLLGGRGYWPYGVEQIAAACRARGIALAFLPGDDQPDADLMGFSTLPAEAAHRLWRYLVQGGIDNAAQFLAYGGSLIGADLPWREPVPLMRAGLYRPELREPWRAEAPVAAVVFYRALVQAGDLAPVDDLLKALRAEGLNPLAVYVASLKDPVAAALLAEQLAEVEPAVIVNLTGFSVSSPDGPKASPFDAVDAPVIQAVLAGGDEAAWRAGSRGLGPRDIAMNIALPEVDGRIIGRAISFKGANQRDPATQCDVVRHRPVADRIAFTARLAANWARLRIAPPGRRRIAVVLANYPNRDGRIGNGVGLDTPASAVVVLKALAEAGYDAPDVPADGDQLVRRLLDGPTNADPTRAAPESLPLPDYLAFYRELPEAVRRAVEDRWGTPERDPFFRGGEVDCGAFQLPLLRLGNVAVMIQPARGYNIDPSGSYHDPALPPPHGYLAAYAWLRESFGIHAVVHLGKHGNLEWLPGKALALSEDCFPEAVLGPLPHLYPFIVNDPGEGAQAKRRAQAVIVDHLTPPLTRAESYGPLRDLELLVDEYYQASGVDPRRLRVLAREIVTLARASGLDADCGIDPNDGEDAAIRKLDAHLCDLKDMQIRDGLHVFGRAPQGRLLNDLLVALVRVPRGRGEGGDASLIRALADDLELDFDPLACDPAAPWTGARPAALAHDDPWRSCGDAVERLEVLASALTAGERPCDPAWIRGRAVLDTVSRLRATVAACGDGEIAGLLTGLDGRFVPPGPSGAPTRGRPEVLPTGRNFYSVDTRAVPTPAAWQLGWKSAALLVERYAQEHGTWPRALALSAWGTSNMRTGGDDIAQALALIGAKPAWDALSQRVTGFEILPAGLLDRPRVDVTLRVSGFFRDAFPGLIDLFDSATRAVAELDEPADVNPLAVRVREERTLLEAAGLSPDEAARRSGFRVFGSKPGAYGAGLQALIDERGWESDADLARAYLAWGGYAYGAGAAGEAAQGLFETRLAGVEAVVQNQDNREHDLLDSDDYYQFEGGLTAAVRHLSGAQPAVYHPDHSRPETPRIRTLDEEIARVVRARAANPKWIAGVMRHGYKGAFEMAATVDYLFAFAATARCVKDHHFDALFAAYLDDPPVLDFLRRHNPDALAEMAARFEEALQRGLWRPRINHAPERLAQLRSPPP